MQSKILLSTILRPTCIAFSSGTLKDNVFVNNLINFKSRFFTIDITDHFLGFIKYENDVTTDKILPTQTCYRVINETTLNVFYHRFSMLDTTKIE